MISAQNLLGFTDEEKKLPFIVSVNTEISYGEIQNLLGSASTFLKSKSTEDRKIFGYLFKSRIGLVIYLLAGWQSQIIPVIINPDQTEDEIRVQAAQAGCKIILTDTPSEIRNKISAITVGAVPLPELKQFENRLSEISEEFTAVVLFTSGTSGKASAVGLKFSHLIASASNAAKVFRFNSSDRWLASLPFYHIGGFSIFFRAVMFRSALIIPEDMKRSSLCKSVRKFHPTLISLVSPQIKTLADENCAAPESLRAVFVGGGFTDYQLTTEALKKGWKINIVYGSTETSSMLTVLREKELLSVPGSVGKALPGNEICILNEKGEILKSNHSGEIAVKGASVIDKYFNDTGNDTEKFLNGWYLTGDIGFINSDGYLFITGRKSNLISTGGKKVTAEEIESEIRKLNIVKDVCVAGKRDREWGEVVSAVIVLNESITPDSKQIISALSKSLPSYKLPKIILFADKLPYTSTGKINRAAVQRLLNLE